MDVPSESFSGLTTRDKIITAAEAVALIRDGDAVMVEGFAGQCFAEELTLALEERFLRTGAPRDLRLGPLPQSARGPIDISNWHSHVRRGSLDRHRPSVRQTGTRVSTPRMGLRGPGGVGTAGDMGN